MPVSSRTRARYILTFIDDYSRFAWLYPIEHKFETFEKFKHFKRHVKNDFSYWISCIHSDYRGEYLCNLKTGWRMHED
ncbi:unnamed protein product [Calypogeia fissa]